MAKEMNAAEKQAEKNKVPKSVVLTDAEGNEYTLQFNRKVVKQMQRNGFVLDFDRLYMCATDLIAGAFRMHHPWLKADDCEEIFRHQNNRGELLGILANMFSAPALDLMGEDANEGDANPTFKVNY